MRKAFVLAALATVACQPGHSRHAQASATAPSGHADSHVVAVQADDLASAFRADPGAAQVRFGGKTLSVTGDVASVWKSGISVVATLREPGSRDPVAAALDEDFDGSPDKVRAGQTITVDCTDLHAYDKPLMLRHCKLAGVPS